MKYQLKNIRLSSGTVQTPGAFFGQKYQWLSAELYNDEDIFANPGRLPRFYCMTDDVVNLYKPYAKPDTTPGALPDTLLVDEAILKQAITEGKVPDLLHISQIHTCTVTLDAPYARVYRADVVDPATHVTVHKKNDFIKSGNNDVIPVTQLTLYLKKKYDPEAAAVDPTKAWSWVESPENVARRVLERSYRRYDVSATQAAPAEAPIAQPADTTNAEVAAARQALAGAGV